MAKYIARETVIGTINGRSVKIRAGKEYGEHVAKSFPAVFEKVEEVKVEKVVEPTPIIEETIIVEEEVIEDEPLVEEEEIINDEPEEEIKGYTKEELENKSALEIREIAKDMNIEYTNKTKTIKAILKK